MFGVNKSFKILVGSVSGGVEEQLHSILSWSKNKTNSRNQFPAQVPVKQSSTGN